MSRYIAILMFFFCISTYAATSLRVGSKVLMVGDSAAKVLQLMGEPTLRTFLRGTTGGMPDNQLASGEQWQYVQAGRTIVVTVVNGRVTNFETLYD